MVTRVRKVHERFPDEMRIIGQLLTDYVELEISLMNCVQVVHDDLDGVFKAMFRPRGETKRIDIADGLGRTSYEKWGLGTEFAMAIGAMRHALKIRDQYSHCIWQASVNELKFGGLEELASDNQPLSDLDDVAFKEITLDLLEEQYAYFVYTDHLLRWVNYEGRALANKITSANLLSKPEPRAQPDLYIP
jgi:hypothetical protein